ncbi:unnamed protein product [Ostreobium quekettii]|uniref:EF-hand domain-containing protein n=1 Tax=Ostreobium quekettii TaxID=121088 RepID=A0A8S1JE46_9CHLO|nr:unnamed protein product [Ostreobium quekettii]
MPRRRKAELVEGALDILYLNHVGNSLVGSMGRMGISGGQRKRVNIGMELVANPSVLFLDEPTSGLDATSSIDVLSGLGAMGDLGMTIITVIHQPRPAIFLSFDQVLLLGTGGKTVYLGPPHTVQEYLEHQGFACPEFENPADFCLDVISGKCCRRNDPCFVPTLLSELWKADGRKWVQGRLRGSSFARARSKSEVLTPEVLGYMFKKFDEIDADGNGKLSVEEIHRLFTERMGVECTMDVVEVLVAGLDRDEDGQVNRDELIAAVNEAASARLSCETESPSGDKRAETGAETNPDNPSSDSIKVYKVGDKTEPSGAQLVAGMRSGEAGPTHRGGVPPSKLSRGSTSPVEAIGGPGDRSPPDVAVELRRAYPDDRPASVTARLRTGVGDLIHKSARSMTEFAYRVALRGGEAEQLEAFLGSRQSPTPARQFATLVHRSFVQRARTLTTTLTLDTLFSVLGAVVVGTLHGNGWQGWPKVRYIPKFAAFAMVVLGLLSTVSHLRTFSSRKALFRREALSGLSPTAYFLAWNLVDLSCMVVMPAAFIAPYYYLTLPTMSFAAYYCIGLAVCMWASGVAYMVSAFLPRQSVLVAGVFVTLIFGAFVTGLDPPISSFRGTAVEYLLSVSYNRWAIEALTISEWKGYGWHLQNVITAMSAAIGICKVDVAIASVDGQDLDVIKLRDFDIAKSCNGAVTTAFTALILEGLIFRVIALIGLRRLRKSRR